METLNVFKEAENIFYSLDSIQSITIDWIKTQQVFQ